MRRPADDWMERADDQPKGKTFDRIPAVVSAAEPSGFRGAVSFEDCAELRVHRKDLLLRRNIIDGHHVCSRDAPERRCVNPPAPVRNCVTDL